MPDFSRFDADDPLNWDADAASEEVVDWPELEAALGPQAPLPQYNWWQAWRLVLSRPFPQTFDTLLQDPSAGLGRANSWLALAGAISSVAPIFLVAVLRNTDTSGLFAAGISAACIAPFGVIGYMVVVLLGMAAVHISARALGGDETFDKAAYALSLSIAPLTVVVSILSVVLGAIMSATVALAVFLSAVAVIAASVYQIVLAAMAVQRVYRIGWGESTIAALAPLLLLYACGCSCLSLVLASGNTSIL